MKMIKTDKLVFEYAKRDEEYQILRYKCENGFKKGENLMWCEKSGFAVFFFKQRTAYEVTV